MKDLSEINMMKNLTINPDRKFYSQYALKLCYKKLQETKEPIIISADTFWQIPNKMLEGVNYELYQFDKEWANEHHFSTTFQMVYKDLITAVQCNEKKYTDEIIFVGMPWELDKANKYFGDGMLKNAYEES